MRTRSIVVTAVAAAVLAVGGGTALAVGAGADRTATPVPQAASQPGPPTADPAPRTLPVVIPPSGPAGPVVDARDAEQTALNTAGGGVVTGIDLDDRYDAGSPAKWEIDVRNGNVDHEIDVDARTGTVLKHEIDDQPGDGNHLD